MQQQQQTQLLVPQDSSTHLKDPLNISQSFARDNLSGYQATQGARKKNLQISAHRNNLSPYAEEPLSKYVLQSPATGRSLFNQASESMSVQFQSQSQSPSNQLLSVRLPVIERSRNFSVSNESTVQQAKGQPRAQSIHQTSQQSSTQKHDNRERLAMPAIPNVSKNQSPTSDPQKVFEQFSKNKFQNVAIYSRREATLNR